MATLSQLINAKAIALAKLAVHATTTAGSGHPTSALSLAHLIATLMYHTMRWRPEQPRDPGADRLVLSEGHAVPSGVSVIPSSSAWAPRLRRTVTAWDVAHRSRAPEPGRSMDHTH
jgi:transketolase N-terminal domain/subunit